MGFSTNVSPRGLFVQGSHLEVQGTPIRIEIELPTGKVELGGVVAWTRWLPVQLRQAMKMGFGVSLNEPPLGWELLFPDP